MHIRSLSVHQLVIGVAFFLTFFANGAFFTHVIATYPHTFEMAIKIASVGIVFTVVSTVVLSLGSFTRSVKPLLITILIVSSQSAYFMDTYDVVIDAHMIQNILETDLAESRDLLSWKQAFYVLVLGILPSWWVYKVPVITQSLRTLWIAKLKLLLLSLLILGAIIGIFGKFYASFFREHKPLRYYANPTYYLYSMGKYVHDAFAHPYSGLHVLGEDVHLAPKHEGRKLIIMIVGEAARWDHFSLNGYGRNTNPLIAQEGVINFPQMSSCGTETGVSVPCMFSSFGRSGYDKEKALHTENVLDILHRAGVHILWRDNNSDSKGVATRLTYEDFKDPKRNTIVDQGEGRDVGMLVGLDRYIAEHPKGDILIVLHQMGNHGPAYYKRYPKAFERFGPICETNQLEQCTQAQITNGYDNALLYSDTFWDQSIEFLKQYNGTFQTALIYMSDHGESLGEKGLYLHGFPYSIAPEAQTHVGSFMWFGSYGIDRDALRERAKAPHSHDALFHTLLGIMDARTRVYNPQLDLLHGLH